MNDSLPVANAIKLTSLRNYKLIQIHVDAVTNVEKHECFCVHIRLYFYEFSSKCLANYSTLKRQHVFKGFLLIQESLNAECICRKGFLSIGYSLND